MILVPRISARHIHDVKQMSFVWHVDVSIIQPHTLGETDHGAVSWRIGSKPKRSDLWWKKSIGVLQQLDSAGQNETFWCGSGDDRKMCMRITTFAKGTTFFLTNWPDPSKTPTQKTTRPSMILHDSFWRLSGATLVIHVQCPLFSWKPVSKTSRSFSKLVAAIHPKVQHLTKVFIAEWRFRELRILQVHLQQWVWAAGDQMRVARTVAQ